MQLDLALISPILHSIKQMQLDLDLISLSHLSGLDWL
jgi:hypothetical protein